MYRLLIAAVLLAAAPAAARAQLTSGNNPSGYAPNMYNRGGQPLSPYLNLLRGGNTAVNYFYGVRPGTQPGAFTGLFGQGAGGARQTYFAGAVDTLADLTDDPQALSRVAPTGHPVGFNNTLNYFGPTSGQVYARGGTGQSPGAQRRAR